MRRYLVDIRVSIRECDDRGNAIYPNGVELQESKQLGTIGFMELTKVLAQLHTAFESIEMLGEDK